MSFISFTPMGDTAAHVGASGDANFGAFDFRFTQDKGPKLDGAKESDLKATVKKWFERGKLMLANLTALEKHIRTTDDLSKTKEVKNDKARKAVVKAQLDEANACKDKIKSALSVIEAAINKNIGQLTMPKPVYDSKTKAPEAEYEFEKNDFAMVKSFTSGARAAALIDAAAPSAAPPVGTTVLENHVGSVKPADLTVQSLTAAAKSKLTDQVLAMLKGGVTNLQKRDELMLHVKKAIDTKFDAGTTTAEAVMQRVLLNTAMLVQEQSAATIQKLTNNEDLKKMKGVMEAYDYTLSLYISALDALATHATTQIEAGSSAVRSVTGVDPVKQADALKLLLYGTDQVKMTEFVTKTNAGRGKLDPISLPFSLHRNGGTLGSGAFSQGVVFMYNSAAMGKMVEMTAEESLAALHLAYEIVGGKVSA